MAFLSVENVCIKGVASAVPTNVKNIRELPFFNEEDAARFIAMSHVERSRIAPEQMCCSDLCHAAAERIIAELGWDKSEIEILVFVSLSRDYVTPNTSAILQDRLGLPKSCLAIDLPFACSGYVYGLSVIASMMQTGCIKKGLLLVGETTSKLQSPLDKSLWPLHGDGGTATALEFSQGAPAMLFNCMTDGSRYDAIINPCGGTRHPFTADALEMEEIEPGIIRNRTQSAMVGMDVFAFSIKEPPACIRSLCSHFGIDIADIDLLLLHQANKYMDDKIGKMLKVPAEKIPFSIMQYGNTSSASIPVTMTVGAREQLSSKSNKAIMCGFGSGLSWAAAYVTLDHIACPELIELDCDGQA